MRTPMEIDWLKITNDNPYSGQALPTIQYIIEQAEKVIFSLTRQSETGRRQSGKTTLRRIGQRRF